MKAIYLKLFVKIPQLHLYFCLLLKFIESHKVLDPQNIQETQNTHEKVFWTFKIPTRKYFGPTKYPRENILNPLNATRIYFGLTKYQRENVLDPRQHNGTSPTMAQEPWNLTHLWIVYMGVDHSRLYRIA